MKYIKKFIVCFFLIGVLFSCDRNPQKDKDVVYVKNEDLSSRNYISFKNYIPSDGFIPTEEIAIKIAEIVLGKIYGLENIEPQRPFSVNLENDVWIIEGHLDEGSDGGAAYIEISKSNGTILKVSHTK